MAENEPARQAYRNSTGTIAFLILNIVSALGTFWLFTSNMNTPSSGLEYFVASAAYAAVWVAIAKRSDRAPMLAWLLTLLVAVGVITRGLVPLQIAYLGVYAFGAYKLQTEWRKSAAAQSMVLPAATPLEHGKTSQMQSLVVTCGFALVLLFGWLVWPTQYRYDSWGRVPIRTNRFNGETERLTSEGWRRLAASPSVNPLDQIFSKESEPSVSQTNRVGSLPPGFVLVDNSPTPSTAANNSAATKTSPDSKTPTSSSREFELGEFDRLSQQARTSGLPCPSELPAGIEATRFPSERIGEVTGGDGDLVAYDLDRQINLSRDESNMWTNIWTANLSVANWTAACISSVEVELTLMGSGSSTKERHTISFGPVLASGKTSSEHVTLRRKTPEHSDPLALQAWRVTKVWGFFPPRTDGSAAH